MKTSEKLSGLLKAVQIYMWQNQNLNQFWSLWTLGYTAWSNSNYPHSLVQEPAPPPLPPELMQAWKAISPLPTIASTTRKVTRL